MLINPLIEKGIGMKRLSFIVAAVFASFLAVAPASAQVRYVGYVQNSLSFDFTRPTFITSSTTLTAAQAHCVASGPTDACGSFTFDPNGFGNDLLTADGTIGGGPIKVTAQFGNGAFTTPGTYSHADSFSQLTVSGSPAPEAASWALMILGFGAAGAALRRRRGRSSALKLALA